MFGIGMGLIALCFFVSHWFQRQKKDTGSIRRSYLYTAYVFLSLSLLSLFLYFYTAILPIRISPVFSSKDMLKTLWTEYKANYLEQGTYRVLDRERNDITTSEGQSYAMLQAVWMDDKETFDNVWSWTKTNLQREDNNLFSWLYGRRSNGSYGILTAEQGQNTASDADTDIALALVFAYSRWQDPDYLRDAKKIISGIWATEVITVNGTPYMAATNVERNSNTTILINPSYLAPYAYRIFARIDTTHDWNALVDSSYDLILNSIRSPLDKSHSAYLPPDWLLLDRRTGQITGLSGLQLTTNYSYDALRLPWRMALDWAWYEDGRAIGILKQFGLLNTEWQTNRQIHASYAHDGTVVELSESPAMYAGSVFAVRELDRNSAQDIYEQKLLSLFNPDSQSWKFPLGYYNENWAWFGIALYNNLLPNLWEGNSTRVR